MQHIKLYENFNKPIVSFDFDGTLHVSVDGRGHPINFDKPDSWVPFTEVFEFVKKEAETNIIICVSGRDEWMKPGMEQFINMHQLPIEAIYVTNDRPKTETLEKLKAIKHYDDIAKTGELLIGTGIEFVKVDPFKRIIGKPILESVEKTHEIKSEIFWRQIIANTVSQSKRKSLGSILDTIMKFQKGFASDRQMAELERAKTGNWVYPPKN